MSKKIAVGLLVGGFFFFHSICFAETIYLKNGKKIRGQIVEKDDKQVKVKISGVKITYYTDEIDHIDATDNQPTSGTTTADKIQPAIFPANEASATSEKPNQLQREPEPSLPSSSTTIPTTPGLPSVTPPPTLPSESTPSASSSTPTVAANVTDTKKSLIFELIDVSGTKETMTQMFSQIIAQAPVEQAPTLKSVLNIDEIISRLVPIYDKYFNDDELKELIAFYKGVTGRKLIKVMPLLMEDSMNASMSYFQEKMPAPNHDGSGTVPENQKENPTK